MENPKKTAFNSFVQPEMVDVKTLQKNKALTKYGRRTSLYLDSKVFSHAKQFCFDNDVKFTNLINDSLTFYMEEKEKGRKEEKKNGRKEEPPEKKKREYLTQIIKCLTLKLFKNYDERT